MVRFYISAMLYYEVASYVTKSVNVQSKLLLLNCYVQLHVCTTVYAKQLALLYNIGVILLLCKCFCSWKFSLRVVSSACITCLYYKYKSKVSYKRLAINISQ